MPIEGDNELKELAESINFLSETERRLRQLETELQAEKEQLIRDLSHDIRTPLTAMLSYSDYLGAERDIGAGGSAGIHCPGATKRPADQGTD